MEAKAEYDAEFEKSIGAEPDVAIAFGLPTQLNV